MAGDVEHVESRAFRDKVNDGFVEEDGDAREDGESADGGPGFFDFEALAHIDGGVDAEQDLGTMMHHGLDADADGFDEDVVWIDIDDKSAEEGESRGIEHASASDPIADLVAIRKEGDERKDVKRGGAKLIWEGIPHIAPSRFEDVLLVDMEREDDLFIDLEEHDDEPSD